MSDEAPVVIKRPKKVVAGDHHSSAWKVAYADFVTAMMAFFLLLWLLNATSEEQKKGLADYFDPSLPISPVSAGGSGVLGGDDLFSKAPFAGTEERGVRPTQRIAETGPDGNERAAGRQIQPGEGESAPGAPDPGTEATAAAEASAEASAAADAEAAAAIEEAFGEALEAAGAGDMAEHLRVRIDADGLTIELVDLVGEPLFAAGSAEPSGLLRELVLLIGPMIGETINPIAVIGHTDAQPFRRQSYSNWELSADRANAARRLLLEAGIGSARIERVVGHAATQPLDDPFAPENRRIAIKLLRMDGR
ncbi:MAG: flagellar motor protein MotB [Pseudomonadota bacterium]